MRKGRYENGWSAQTAQLFRPACVARTEDACRLRSLIKEAPSAFHQARIVHVVRGCWGNQDASYPRGGSMCPWGIVSGQTRTARRFSLNRQVVLGRRAQRE